jgi:hypothetical protein
MKSIFNRITVGMAAAAMVIAQVIMPVQAAFADSLANGSVGAQGNNGTLKVHEYGTADKTESNNPKVCQFNLEGFGFDIGQTGYIQFTVQGNDDPHGTNAGPYSVGPADSTGYFASQYFNTPTGTTIANGHYDVTMYGKDSNNGVNLADVKAKSKDFKVDCDSSPELTNVTAVDGAFNDTCGLTFNLTFTPVVTEGVVYTPVQTGNTITVTASVTDATKYVLTNPDWTQTATDTLEACDTPHILPCTTSTSSTVTKYEDFADYNDTRATGHAEFTADGLHIWTEGATSTDKVAWYNSVTPYSLANIGTPSIDYTSTDDPAPGMQIVLDKDGDGDADGILVGEPTYYGDNWWSNANFGVGSGMGYTSYATLQQYLEANPNAMVMAVGFSLGSGVLADGTLHSITFGCHTWNFEKAPRVPTQCTVHDNEYTTPWKYNGDTYPVADASPAGTPGTATFTEDGLHLITLNQESEAYGLIDAGNTPLVDVDTMNYTTYRDTSSTGYAQTLPAYILEVDKDGNPATTGDHAYLFYEPYNNGTVTEGVWHTWDAINSGSAKWWMSGTGQALHTWNDFTSTILPDATIVAYGFNQGTYNAGANTYIKQMTFDCGVTTFGTPGKGGVTPEVPPVTPPTTPVTPTVPATPGKGAVPAELPETGAGFNFLSIVLLAALAAYGAVYFAQPKRLYE